MSEWDITAVIIELQLWVQNNCFSKRILLHKKIGQLILLKKDSWHVLQSFLRKTSLLKIYKNTGLKIGIAIIFLQKPSDWIKH